MDTGSRYLRERGLIARKPRLTPREPREDPWRGRIVAIDTEGSADTLKFTATACYDDGYGSVERERFRRAEDFCQFLIDVSEPKTPVLIFAHNLEWDFQVLWEWMAQTHFARTRLIYDGHTCRRSGSALTVTFDYEGRSPGRRKIVIRDSFAVWPLSLRELGKAVNLPKLRTPRQYIPHVTNWRTGEPMEVMEDGADPDAPACDRHGRDECTDCYDLRDAEILHRAMRLYVDECDAAHVAPSLTRSAHAMRDWRTNYLPKPLHQYTERQNLRALLARYGGRSQMLTAGLTVADDQNVIAQFDVVSEYPSIMRAGRFPDAGMHHVLHRPAARRLREYVGIAWAEVTIPALPLGPLVYRHANGRTDYPTGCTIQSAWTTDELAYAMDLGCDVRVLRLEGTPDHAALDPFSTWVDDKISQRLTWKAQGNPLQLGAKLGLNGLSGKFGMRWTDPVLAFRASGSPYDRDALPCVRIDDAPRRYPDYIMVPWSALILARGRIMLHRFAMDLIARGARLLCCDTDSWAVEIARDELARLPLGHALGEWEQDGGNYVAFRGAAPKEYALYKDAREVFAGEPSKARAKGIGSLGVGPEERARAIDHYLRTGNVHFQRPQKTRSVLRGAPMATFVHVEKTRHPRIEYPIPAPLPFDEFAARVRQEIEDAEAMRVRPADMETAPAPRADAAS